MNLIISDKNIFRKYSYFLSSFEDGVTLRNKGTTSVTPVPPQVVGLTPVRCTPGSDLLGCKEDDDGQENKERQELEHFEVRFWSKI